MGSSHGLDGGGEERRECCCVAAEWRLLHGCKYVIRSTLSMMWSLFSLFGWALVAWSSCHSVYRSI